MERSRFDADLARDGYSPAAEITLAPDERREPHTHDFAVRGLVARGVLTLVCDGTEQHFHAGERFELQRGRLHHERTGATGAVYWAGRRA